jgi:hypothetical protein
MDVSIASAEARAEAAPAEEAPAPLPAHRQTAVSRGSNVAAGPAIDPALLFKFGKWAAIGVVALLFLWGVMAIISSTRAPAVAHNPPAPAVKPAAAQPVERTITIVAVDAVRVSVVARNADDSEGEELYSGTLARGQSQVVPWPGPIYIKANAGENLQIEYKGKRYGSQFTGVGRAKM